VSDFQIELAAPMHGWMRVLMQSGTDVLEGNASYISDCVTELVYAALETTESRAPRDVHFFEEPDAYRMRITGSGTTVQLTVTHHNKYPPLNNDPAATIALAVQLPRSALATALWSAVNRLVTSHGIPAIEAGWQRPFPAKEFAQLGERVTRARS
jgi:hypothetical protein